MIIAASKGQIDVPPDVRDFDSFCRWLHSPDFPENGKIVYINNDMWMDVTMEELFTHNQVRLEIARVLATLMKKTKYGLFVDEGMRYSHLETNLSTEPDGMIVSNEAIETGRVRFTGCAKGDKTELLGSPEIAIEIVSRSSEEKDTVWAMVAFFDAGIREYWLIDARDEETIRFDIFKRSKKEYVLTRKAAGWVKSSVLGKSFRLVRNENALGNPEFTLEVR